MKVRALLLTLVIAALVLPSTAAASGRSSQASPRIPFVAGRAVLPSWPATPHARVGLLGPFMITGTVLTYGGTPQTDAFADWGWFDPDAAIWEGPGLVYHPGGGSSGPTASDGRFALTGVTSLPGHDMLSLYSESWSMARWGLDFSTTSDYTFRPGALPLTLLNPPSGPIDVMVGDVATGMADTWVDDASGSPSVSTAEPGFSGIQVSKYSSATGAVYSAMDWKSPGGVIVPVTAGTTAAQVSIDWSQARKGRLAGPMCTHSGPASSLVTYRLTAWPAGYTASFDVVSMMSMELLPVWLPNTVTSSGPENTYDVKLRLPAVTAPDVLIVEAYRSDDPVVPLRLYDYYQVCTLKASSTSIRRGGAVRLNGAVPSDRVTLFQRTTQAGQPTSVAARGWTKVGTFSTRNGKYVTGWRKPTRTTWYVMRYQGFVYGAFTKVVRVRVG